jgi:hypothetical protein
MLVAMSPTRSKAAGKEGLLRRLARHSEVLFKDRFREDMPRFAIGDILIPGTSQSFL